MNNIVLPVLSAAVAFFQCIWAMTIETCKKSDSCESGIDHRIVNVLAAVGLLLDLFAIYQNLLVILRKKELDKKLIIAAFFAVVSNIIEDFITWEYDTAYNKNSNELWFFLKHFGLLIAIIFCQGLAMFIHENVSSRGSLYDPEQQERLIWP